MLRDDVQDKLAAVLDLLKETLMRANNPLVDANPSDPPAPSPARRMWKRWGNYMEDGTLYGNSDSSCCGTWPVPVTILPGHSAVEDIEREAFERGLACGKAVCAETPLIPSQIAIDGVLPVVVDGFTWHPSDDFPWCGELKRIDIYKEINGVNCTPCRIHMYVGIGPDGKRAGGNGGES